MAKSQTKNQVSKEKKSPQKKVRLAKPGHVLMTFAENKFYNDPNEPLYMAGVVYDVPVNMADRWLKRGGTILENSDIGPDESNDGGESVEEDGELEETDQE